MIRGHVHAQVNDLVPAAFEHGRDEVFADVMEVALHGADDRIVFRFHTGLDQHGFEDFEGLLHGTGGDEHFRHKDFVAFEAFAHGHHARHKPVFDDTGGAFAGGAGERRWAVGVFALAALRNVHLGILMFGHLAWEVKPDELMEATPPGMQGTNMHHAMATARRMLAGQSGNKQIIMITDGEPTAHITPNGDPWFTYFDGWDAQQLTVEATLREAMRCTKENITINTFMLDADQYQIGRAHV